MILFFHGYQSSNQTNKYVVIQGVKHCETVDYAAMSYADVSELYDTLISSYKPSLLVGHSLGGYWALRKSIETGLPCVIVNPQLFPTVVPGYPSMTHSEIRPDLVTCYVETGDEVIDVPRTLELLEDVDLRVYQGGHHRVQRVDYINTLVAARV